MYYITADATCDLPEELSNLEKFYRLPMPYSFGDNNYEHLTDNALSYQQLYKEFQDGKMPSTSCVTPHTAKKFWTKTLSEGYDILHIDFSSALSATHHNVSRVAEELMKDFPERKIIIVDTLCAGVGEAVLVLKAYRNRSKSMSIEENANYIESIKMRICHYFIVNDLFYLKRGGRISQLSAMIGTAVQLKPILKVDDEGKLANIDKAISRRLGLKNVLNKTIKQYIPGETDLICIAHGNCLNDAEFVKARLQEQFPDIEIGINQTNPILLSHTGIGFLATSLLGKDRNLV